MIDVVVQRLKRFGVMYNRDIKSMSKFLILKNRDAFRQDPPPQLPVSNVFVGSDIESVAILA